MRMERSTFARSSRTTSGSKTGGWLHGDRGHHLQQMILDHVAQGAGFLVIPAAAFDADRLGRRDLHVIDVAAIPERLEDAVSETERQDVLDGLLAQVVIDAIDVLLVENFLEFRVQRSGGRQIVTKRLLDHDATPAPTALKFGVTDPLDRGFVVARLRRQIEENIVLRVSRLLRLLRGGLRASCMYPGRADRLRSREILAEIGPETFIDGRVFKELVQPFLHLFAEVIVGHSGSRVADDGKAGREAALVGEPVQSGNQFALGQVAIGAEDYDGAGRHTTLKPQRILERIRFGHSC